MQFFVRCTVGKRHQESQKENKSKEIVEIFHVTFNNFNFAVYTKDRLFSIFTFLENISINFVEKYDTFKVSSNKKMGISEVEIDGLLNYFCSNSRQKICRYNKREYFENSIIVT